MKKTISFVGVMLVLFLAKSAYPAIVGGSVTVIDPPLNTGNNNQEINKLLGFDELQHVMLTSDLVVDTPDVIVPAGTIVSSHYIIYDPPSVLYITGDVILDQDVIGVIHTTGTLNNSDYLGLPTTNYLNPTLRGYESGDTATIEDPNRVSFDLGAHDPGDYARIITASEYVIQGPQFIMRAPYVVPGGVHTNESGIGSVRLLFDEPISFDTDDITVTNENGQNVVAYATGSGRPFMIITFDTILFADQYTVTIHDSVVSVATGHAIDGDNDGFAGGDYIFTMEHRERHDSDNDNDIDLLDFGRLAEKWLWQE